MGCGGGCGKRIKGSGGDGKRDRKRDCPTCGKPYKRVTDPLTSQTKYHCTSCGYMRG